MLIAHDDVGRLHVRIHLNLVRLAFQVLFLGNVRLVQRILLELLAVSSLQNLRLRNVLTVVAQVVLQEWIFLVLEVSNWSSKVNLRLKEFV